MEETGNTKIDEKSNVAKASGDATQGLPDRAEEPKQNDALEPPFKGFDEAGRYFIVKIDTRYGYLAILGWLQEAADFLKFHIAMQRQAEQQKKVINPNGKKGWSGRFNLFKK